MRPKRRCNRQPIHNGAVRPKRPLYLRAFTIHNSVIMPSRMELLLTAFTIHSSVAMQPQVSRAAAIDGLYDTQQCSYAPSRAAVIDDLYDTQQCSPSEQVQLTVSHHSVAIDQSLTVIVL